MTIDIEAVLGQKEPRRGIFAKPRSEKRPAAFTVQIVPGLSLGNVRATFDSRTLTTNNITAIVSLTECTWLEWYKDTKGFKNVDALTGRHKLVRCVDSSTQDLLVHMSDVCDFIDQMAPQLLANSHSLPDKESSSVPDDNASVLVHCNMGMSRSPTMIIAYLMRKYKIKPDEALQYILTKRKVKPSANFTRQLQIWDEVGYDVWEDKKNAIAKAPYQAFLEDRAVKLEAMSMEQL